MSGLDPMLPSSCFSLLNVEDYTKVDPVRIPHVMNVPGIISEFDEEDQSKDAEVRREKRIIVAHQLPIKAFRDDTTKKLSFEWDNDALVLQLKSGFGPSIEVVYIGCLRVNVEAEEEEDVSRLLYEQFRCLPVYLTEDISNRFYHGFCKHYLWPLFHYMLPLSPDQGVQFDPSMWKAYVSANKKFAETIIGVLNPDEDYVWIQDYHLMILPTILRKMCYPVKLGFFLHGPFPSSEIFRTMPVRDEILKGLLNCDLIGFHTYDYARHFLTCCNRVLGLDFQSKRGYIGIDYFGRTVSLKILPVGIDMGQLEAFMSLDGTAKKVKGLKEKYEGKIVMLGVDDMDMFKGISLKFLAMRHLLDKFPNLRGQVVLVQIVNPARSSGKDIKELEVEIYDVVREINAKYGWPDYDPIVFVNGPVSTQDKVAYYSISDCVVVNAVRDGMNLVPYKYTVCRQGSTILDKALGIENSDTKRKSVIIVSEFIGCSPSLSGAIRVNPWDINSVSDAMNVAISMEESEKEMRHNKHYKYIASHDVAYWAKSFDQDLERACKEHYLKRYWALGLGLGFRVVALDRNFRKLTKDHIGLSYNRTKSRLILLDYDGTLMPQSILNKSPEDKVISVLNVLSNDPKNIVFIVSGRGKDSLGKWFSPCEKLGLSAEHGYFTRWDKESRWESAELTTNFDWKKIALPVMQHYTEATDGSFIEQKESALVWHHQQAAPDFGSWQAKELLNHLESVLANEPVVVKRGYEIVEVKPQGVSKGVVVENLIVSMQAKNRVPDFILCVGDDRSDEEMFEKIANSTVPEVFACTVGNKPSMARYFLDDPENVMKMLETLSTSGSLLSFEGCL